jgi:2-polyprenyl-6-methoxyphenol hydroxylase-like FAD-dependent oxidoreductase
MHIMIAGGGIGGLTMALCLHKIGIKATVFESSDDIRELGVGINVLPHAMKILRELDLEERMLDSGVELERYMWFNRHGQEIWSDLRGRKAGYEWPQISMHRGQFQGLLANAVRERIGPDAIRCNHHLADFAQQSGRVTANFIDKRNNQQVGSFEADGLIGADGIHSCIRSHFYPDEGPARWSGNMLWRMTVEIDPVLGGQTMIAVGNSETKVVGYEISAEAKRRGKSLFNWIAEVKLAKAGTAVPRREDWNQTSSVDEFLTRFADWNFGWLSIPELARKTEQVWSFPMVDRDPVEKWTEGRVTLLGDAAHAMWPIGSNGASQAILDCHCMANQLSTTGSVAAAFSAYEDDRRPATAAIVLAKRGNAHDEILEIAEQRAPDGFESIDEFSSTEELRSIVNGYKQTALFDKQRLQS